MSLRHPIAALIAVSLTLLGGCWQQPEQTRYITDAQGRALILHGINSSSSAKNPDTGHLPWVTEADVRQETREWGFNFVRLLIFWDGIEPVRGVYDEAYLDAVEERVRWYTDNGAWVMLDMHQDIYGHAVGGNGAPEWATETGLPAGFSLDFPNMPWWVKNIDPSVIGAFVNFWQYREHQYLQDHYIAAWQKVAERFRDHPGVIAYDLMNEPHAGDLTKALGFTFEGSWLIGLYDRLIPAIRAVDPDKWIAFEPQSLAVNFGVRSRLPFVNDARDGDRKLVYAPHMYPFLLHEGVAYNLTDQLQMRDWNRNRTRELNLQQTPLIVGEFGGSDSTPGFDLFLRDTLAMYDTMGASWAWWSNDPGSWGLIDSNGNEMPKVNQLVRPYPRAIAGQPVRFGFDPATRLFELEFDPKEGVSGETEIFIPQRHYPDGWELQVSAESGPWQSHWDEERQILFVDFSEPSTRRTLTITPR